LLTKRKSFWLENNEPAYFPPVPTLQIGATRGNWLEPVMRTFIDIVIANVFWLSFIFAFVPIMCMRALVKNQLACFKDEGWNLLKTLEKLRSGYTSSLELNWVPKTTRGLALSLSISALWSITLLTWAVYQINESYSLSVQTIGQVVSVNNILSTNHKLPYVLIDSVQYRYQIGSTIYSGTTLADRNHFKGQSVFVMYDKQRPERSSIETFSAPVLVDDAAFSALPLPIVTVLCLIYSLCNLRLLLKLRSDWNADAPVKLD